MFAGVLAACAYAGDGKGNPTGGGVDAPPPPPDAPIFVEPDAAAVTCTAATTCMAASDLGAVSGDTGDMRLMASGTGPGWYRVRVSEDYHSLIGRTLRVAAKLTSPTTTDFDVVVYVPPAVNSIECSAPTGTPSNNGGVEETRAEWGDGPGMNDTRDVTVEVRHVSGTCDPSSTWQLEIEGNWI